MDPDGLLVRRATEHDRHTLGTPYDDTIVYVLADPAAEPDAPAAAACRIAHLRNGAVELQALDAPDQAAAARLVAALADALRASGHSRLQVSADDAAAAAPFLSMGFRVAHADPPLLLALDL